MHRNGLRAALAGLLLVLLLPGIALAALYEHAGSSEVDACLNIVNSSSGANACLGEHSTSGWPSGDLLILTNGSDVANLGGIAHGFNTRPYPQNRCDEDDVSVDNWNDCLTDAYVKLPAGWCFRAYTDADYYGQRVFAASNWASNAGSATYYFHFATATTLNNTISSIRLYTC